MVAESWELQWHGGALPPKWALLNKLRSVIVLLKGYTGSKSRCGTISTATYGHFTTKIQLLTISISRKHVTAL
jgi:hypothetical protein